MASPLAPAPTTALAPQDAPAPPRRRSPLRWLLVGLASLLTLSLVFAGVLVALVNIYVFSGVEQMTEAAKVEAQVAGLIREMDASIAEAEAFIAQMGAP